MIECLDTIQATPKRPTIPADYGSKVPTAVRQRYLNMFIDEALKIYHNEKDAFDRVRVVIFSPNKLYKIVICVSRYIKRTNVPELL